jgi:hypothetical protein
MSRFGLVRISPRTPIFRSFFKKSQSFGRAFPRVIARLQHSQQQSQLPEPETIRAKLFELPKVVSSSGMTPADYHRRTVNAMAPWRAKLLQHPVYASVQNAADLKAFMSVHVFAVWDFMCLVKSLQNRFAPSAVPWVPPQSRLASFIINGIVLGEESDSFDELIALTGQPHMSHAELYARSMTAMGADTTHYHKLLDNIRKGVDMFDGLTVDPTIVQFVRQTLAYCRADEPDHVVAAAFLFGREDPIPDMFKRVLEALPETLPGAQLLRVYMLRHIEVDSGEHGPQAQQLLEELCGVDERKWESVAQTGISAIQARMRLWDAAVKAIYTARKGASLTVTPASPRSSKK